MKENKRDSDFRKKCAAFFGWIWQAYAGAERFPATICNLVNGTGKNGKTFFPSGAIFFFVALLVFYAVLWLVIYGVMIARS